MAMGKMSCLVVLCTCLINAGFGLGGVSGEKGCNGTVGDCFSYGSDVEFLGGEEAAGDLLRHYAAGARWLLQQGGKPGGKKALQQPNRGTCRTDQYSNCIVPGSGITCTAYNRCKRAA